MLGLLLMILLILWLLLQTCWMQNKVLPIALDQLSSVIGAEVKAKSIDIDFFEEITLNDVFVEGAKGDTLVFAEYLNVDLSIFSFFGKTLFIDDITLSGGKIYLSDKDGQSNYQHILDHFSKSTDSEKTSSDAGVSWKLGLDDIIFDDIVISQIGTNSDMVITIPSLTADLTSFPEKFDTVSFDELISKGLVFSLVEKQASSTVSGPTKFPTLPFHLSVKDLQLSEAKVVYEKSYKPRKKSGFDTNHIDITNTTLSVSDLEWGSAISGKIEELKFTNQSDWELKELSTRLYVSDTKLALDDLKVETRNSNLIGSVALEYASFDDLLNSIANQGIKASISQSKINTKDISYFIDPTTLSFMNIDYANNITYAGNLSSTNGRFQLLKTNLKIDNKLRMNGDVSFDLNGSTKYSAKISNIKTTQNHLVSLFPTLVIPKEIKNLGEVDGSIYMSGDRTSIDVQNIDLTIGNNSIIQGRGKITRLDRAPDIWMDFYFDKLFMNPIDILQGEAIPTQVYNMGHIDYVGSFVGNTLDLSMDGKLKTDIGNADLDASILFNSDYSSAKYKGEFDLDGFDLGVLLQDTTFGLVTAVGAIDGEGFDPNSLNATVNVKSDVFEYGGESYEDITIRGVYAESSFTGRIISNDDKVKLNFDGLADLNGADTEIEFTSAIERIDLTQFGIGDSLFWISGLLTGKLRGNNIDNFIGGGNIKNLKIGTQNGVYSSDTIVQFTAEEVEGDSKSYRLESSFLDGKVEGNIKLSELAKVMEAYLKNYIPIGLGYEDAEAADTFIFDNQEFSVDLKSKNLNPLLEVVVGDDIHLKQGYLKGNFSNEESKIDFKGSIDSLEYKGYIVENGSYFFDGRKDFINGNIILENISDGKETLIYEADINTNLNNKVANIILELFDEKDEQTLLIGSDVSRTDDYVINFNDTLIINKSIWNFSEFNKVTYGDSGLYMQDVRVSKGEQAITAYTDENENGQAIEVLADNFILSELTAIIGKENEYFEGEINGAAIINNVWGKPFVTADVEMSKIMLQDYVVGTANVEAVQDTETNTVVTKVKLKGPENDASLDLTYGIDDRSIKGYLDMTRLEITTLDPFLTEILTDSDGHLVGRVKIAGTPTKPEINGKVDLVGIQTTPVFTNSRYAILDQTISIDNESISFGDMVIVDMNNNVANLSGQILHTNLSEMYLDLVIDTDKFLFLNTTPIENPLFYGKVTVEAAVSIQGPIEDIKIDGAAKAIDNSKLALSPFSVERLDYETDFIIYADPRKISLDSLNAQAKRNGNTFPFDLDLKLTVEEDSEFEMVMNPITGDNITGRGNADLTFGLKKTGEMDLFGTYTVTSGKYLFTFGPISKVFEIQQGGRVVFNGDPLQGMLDVTAIYEANTAVYDLIAQELGTAASDSEIAETKRKRRINVILGLSNSILKPEILMDLQQLENDVGNNAEVYEKVDRKLEDLRTEPNELNKQVFGLLLLNSFILTSSNDVNFVQTGANIGFSSLSGLVTSQLNKLTEGLIKGVELNFDVNSYSSDFVSTGDAGLVTELGVGVSKKLFNDRLTLSAGTNVDLESTSSTALFNNLAGDFVISYQLTADGKFNIKIFRKSNANIIDENSSKNGVGVNYRKEFGSIKKKTKEKQTKN